MRCEVAPGVGEPARALREDELCPDAVGRRRQQPLVVEREEAGEPTEPGFHGLRPGGFDGDPQPLDHFLGLGQRDAGLAVRAHSEDLGDELGPALGPAGLEADERVADEHVGVQPVDAEDLRERDGLLLRILRAQVELAEPQLVDVAEEVLDPVPRRVDLEPVPGFRGDERPLAGVVLDLQPEVGGPLERLREAVVVEGDADVVDARVLPVARLEDDVDGAAGELDEPQAEAHRVELLPRRARLEPLGGLALPAVPAEEAEAELAEVTGLEEPHLARHEVVVEELHDPSHRNRRALREPPRAFTMQPTARGRRRMTSTPPPPPPPPQSYERPYYGVPAVPAPPGELIVFLVAWVVALIVTLAADDVGWNQFLLATVLLSAAYMIARGIAKAGKVYEGR